MVRKENFIKGKWYKWTSHSKGYNCLVYYKYSHRENQNYYYTERINYKEGHSYLNSYVNPHFPDQIEANMSEIATYLPLGHPDLQSISLINDFIIF